MSELKEVMQEKKMDIEDVLKLERAHHEHDSLVKQAKAARMEAKLNAQQRTILKYMAADVEKKEQAAQTSEKHYQEKLKVLQDEHKDYVHGLQKKYGLEKGFGINPETFEIIQGGAE